MEMDYQSKGGENMEQENNILFYISADQAVVIANHFGKDVKELEEYEIAELLDRIIDEEL